MRERASHEEGVTPTGWIPYVGVASERMPGSEPADTISGRLYTSKGDTLAYVCELEGTPPYRPGTSRRFM
jgi:hypothetical protein